MVAGSGAGTAYPFPTVFSVVVSEVWFRLGVFSRVRRMSSGALVALGVLFVALCIFMYTAVPASLVRFPVAAGVMLGSLACIVL